ncbi:MarR family transcriptional regulator [Acidianus sulfidivorans JP7]|uniref:MarR family transcriptional regulator n=1 Tax=Acidianus sulfidivorans JP7 TaxID=619593 RepID=A0A2U9INV1_9CREN|nr:MarR family transcriptional regulator [Acidianus sulfidivorans]AWR97695.1 MarR family transcriptional regulator [Acidianus sulfidivorans JP7]
MNSKDKILSILRQKGSLPQSELVKISGISKSRISEVLSQLEKEGIIKRRTIAGKNLIVSLNEKRFLRLGIITAAEYPFIMPFVKKLKEKNIDVEIKIYNNGLDVTKDLALGKIDLGFSPVVSQMIFSKIFNINIIAGGAKGGGGIVGNSNDIGSTVLSSMEVWTLKELKDVRIIPFNSPLEMLDKFERKQINAIAIWEPYLSILEAKGHTISHNFDYNHCCTLAVRDGLEYDEIKKIYEDSFSWFMSSKDRWISSYANLLNQDYNLLKKSTLRYEFDSYLDLHEIYNTLKKSNIYIPAF